MKKLNILYLNGVEDSFSEEQLDCSTLTLAGHAAKIVEAFGKKADEKKDLENAYLVLDAYHLIRMDQIISVRLS